MSRPTLRQFEYLIALDDEKSFLAASQKCNVTQPTLSAGIRELEDALEQPLVNRGNRKNITLTAFGSEVVQDARKIMRDTEKVMTRAKHLKAPLTGPLRMGVIPTIAPYFLPDILPAIQRNFPALELQLHEDLSERLVDQCQKDMLDVILMAFPYDTPALTQMFLFEEPFALACPKGQEPPRKSISIVELETKELLLLDDGHCLSDHAIAACGLQKPSKSKAYSATSLQTLIQMVSHNYGMTLLPEMATYSGHIPKNVSIVPFRKPKPTRKIGIAWRRGHPRRKEFEDLGKIMLNT